LEFLDELSTPVVVPPGDDHGDPLPGKSDSRCAADTRERTRDERYLFVVLHCPTPDDAHWGSPNHAERELEG
jgi:hypothetical protein